MKPKVAKTEPLKKRKPADARDRKEKAIAKAKDPENQV